MFDLDKIDANQIDNHLGLAYNDLKATHNIITRFKGELRAEAPKGQVAPVCTGVAKLSGYKTLIRIISGKSQFTGTDGASRTDGESLRSMTEEHSKG